MSTPEQKALYEGIVALVAEIQTAARRAMPSNRELHQAFGVGMGAASPSEAVALARAIEPALREHRMLLIGRGVDGAKVNQLARQASALEALLARSPDPGPAGGAKAGSRNAKRRGAA